MVRACYAGKSANGRDSRNIGLAPCGCGVLPALQSDPTLGASKGAALEPSLANWDFKCCLFPTKTTLCGLGSPGKVVKSGEKTESMLEFFLLHFPSLDGWISDKKSDLLGLGADEAIAVCARLTLRQRVGVAGEEEPPERVCASVPCLCLCPVPVLLSRVCVSVPYLCLCPVSVSLSCVCVSVPRPVPCTPWEGPRTALPLACPSCRPAPPLPLPAPWQARNPSLSRETPLECSLLMVGPVCLWALEQGSGVVGFSERSGFIRDGSDTESP